MILLLHACSYVAAVFAFLFVTLSLASGLLYLSEIIEEHSRLAKTVGQRLIYAVVVAHVLFCVVDHLPWHLCLLGVVCHAVYLQNFSKTWPFISLTSPTFLASCLLVIIDHFAWFFHFADRAKEVPSHYRGMRSPYRSSWDKPRSRAEEPLSFMDVATFFGFCVWLVPFFLFLSLSANDNVLPSSSDGMGLPSTPQIKAPNGNVISLQTAPRTSILKAVLDPLMSLIPLRARGYRGSRSQRDGLIASPQRSAPPSPNLYGSPGPTQSWNGYTSPPPPLSPGALGGSQLGASNSTPTLSPRASFGAFREAANNRFGPAGPPSPLGVPSIPRRSNTSPAPGGMRQPYPAMGDDAFASEPAPMAWTGNAPAPGQAPAGMTKRKVG